MTKKEFLDAIKDFPDSMEMFVDNRDPDADFQMELVDSVSIKKVVFSDGSLKAKDDVIVIETA